MGERILITGGAGFIGCVLGAELVAKGHEVVAFDNLHPQVHTGFGLPPALSPGVRLVPGDLTVASNVHALLKFFRPDVVAHLAAETGTGQSLTEATRHTSVNVTGTAQLIDAMSACNHVPRLIVLASSRAIYGDGAWKDGSGQVFYPAGRARAELEKHRWDFVGPDGLPARSLPHEAAITRPNPISVYGATKLCQEHVLSAWCRAFRCALTVLRFQNVYGPGQAPQNSYTGVLTLFARLARERAALDVYEDGEIIRDFVHVSDVVQSMTAAISKSVPPDATYDIGSGAPTTIFAVAQKIAELTGAPSPVVSKKFRDGDVRAAWCSIEAAKSSLGYQPRVPLETGLQTLVNQRWSNS